MRQNWAEGAPTWVENQATFDAVFAPVTGAILEAAAIAAGQRMLDVGCGTGTLLEAGAAAGADVVGVDIAEAMAAAARRRVPEATVIVADAQTTDVIAAAPGAPFDRVVSRFGVMFFEDPEAAFANLRRATAPDARLVFACWRDLDENPMFSLGSSVLADRLDPQPETPAPGEPGPAAFADPDRVLSLLEGAGWGRIRVSPFDFTCDYGFNGTDGVEERMATISGGGVGRLAREQLLPRLGEDGWASLLDDVRTELRRHLVDGVLRFPAAIWLVEAAN
jgi:SAM-dependent methyltransferase